MLAWRECCLHVVRVYLAISAAQASSSCLDLLPGSCEHTGWSYQALWQSTPMIDPCQLQARRSAVLMFRSQSVDSVKRSELAPKETWRHFAIILSTLVHNASEVPICRGCSLKRHEDARSGEFTTSVWRQIRGFASQRQTTGIYPVSTRMDRQPVCTRT